MALKWRDRVNTRLVITAIAIFLFCLLFTLPELVDRFNRISIPQYEYAQLRSFFDEPIDIPSDWFEAKAFSTEFEEERKAFSDTVEEWHPQSFQTVRDQEYSDFVTQVFGELAEGKGLAEEDWIRIEDDLNRQQGLIDAWTEFSRDPEYRFTLLPIDGGPKNHPILTSQQAARLACLRGWGSIREGTLETGIEDLLTPFYMARRRPSEILFCHILALGALSMGTEQLSRFAMECEDPTILSNVLNRLVEISGEVRHESLDRAALSDVIGQLNTLKIVHGREYQVEPNRPGGFYFNQLFEWGSPACEWGGTISDPAYANWVRAFGPGSALGRFYRLNETMFILTGFNFLEAGIREQTANAGFDLLLLHLANRIRELEGRDPVTDARELANETGSLEFVDPFSNDPYSWNKPSRRFQSVGPDGLEGTDFRYDPTNGTKSTGDIWLPLGD